MRCAQSRRAQCDGEIRLAIDQFDLQRVAEHRVVGQRVEQIEHGSRLHARRRSEPDVRRVDHIGERGPRNHARVFVLHGDAQAISPFAHVDCIHIDQRGAADQRAGRRVRQVKHGIHGDFGRACRREVRSQLVEELFARRGSDANEIVGRVVRAVGTRTAVAPGSASSASTVG